jgi:DegT/DnrJ/EryC1/StrS aminotransferase family
MKTSAGRDTSHDGTNPLYEPLPHMRPHIRIAPFSPVMLEALRGVQSDGTRFPSKDPATWLAEGKSVRFYASGRDALSACLELERLERDDEVVIVTTTHGPYISSCVTDKIERVCGWSRHLSPKTRMALVIHEFGFPCDSDIISECQSRDIPVVEDCAFALGSRMEGAPVGSYGDYAIYSLAKHFPVPFGGVLASRRNIDPKRTAGALPRRHEAVLLSLLRGVAELFVRSNKIRRRNWQWFTETLQPFGMEPYFTLPSSVVPGAYVMRLAVGVDGGKLKRDLVEAGVEATEYYGMGGFYLPVHQCLTDYDRKYISYHVAKSLASNAPH